MTHPAYRPTLELVLREALDYLDQVDDRPVRPTASLAELRSRLGKVLNDESIAANQVLEDLVRDTRGGFLASTGGRFFAWAIGGSLPAAVGADWLTSVWDQNATLYRSSPAASVIEEVAGLWLKELLRLPLSASFAFVNGCQMAHATCLAAARNELLSQRGWDVEKQGLAGSPGCRVIASNRHGSIERAVRLLGIGEGNVIDLPLDATELATAEALEQALRDTTAGVPTIVILQAGEFNTGGFDRFEELIPLAKSHGAWVHIDGAFGLWAAASSKFDHLLRGCDRADSWVTDGHKWLNVPFDSGYAFVARGAAHRAAMSVRASYLVHDPEARDQINWNPEWSRRARGFSTYAALRELGRNGIADLVNRCCGFAQMLTDGLAELRGVELLWRPVLNQGLVRFRHPSAGTEDDHDAYTDTVIQRIVAEGCTFFMGTKWHGHRVMRISVLNWQTDRQSIDTAIRAVAKCLLPEYGR